MKAKFGIQLPTWAGFSYAEIIEQAILAEKTGFSYICVPDHFFLRERFYNMFKATYPRCDPAQKDMFDPWVILSAIAAVTDEVKLGPGVTPIPFYNPARLAKTIASLDHVSKGRFILGAGAGWHREEAESYNITWANFATRLLMMKEGIELMTKLWTTNSNVTWHGSYYAVNSAPAWPKPVQKPYPPIWYGGNSDMITETVAKSGDGWCPYVTSEFSPNVYREKWIKIMKLARKAGRDVEKMTPSAHVIISMEKNYDRALQKYTTTMKHLFDRDLTEQELNLGIFGTPDDCIHGFEKYFEAGVRHFILNPYPHPDDVKEWFKVFAEKIIPYFNR